MVAPGSGPAAIGPFPAPPIAAPPGRHCTGLDQSVFKQYIKCISFNFTLPGPAMLVHVGFLILCFLIMSLGLHWSLLALALAVYVIPGKKKQADQPPARIRQDYR